MMDNDLFSEFKNRFAPKQEEEIHPADKFLAERRAMMKQREEAVADVLTPEQMAQREAKRLPADKEHDVRPLTKTPDEAYEPDEVDMYFASGAYEMRKEHVMEQIAKIPNYESMPLGMKEIQEKMGVYDHGLGFFKANRSLTGERLIDTYEKYRKDNPEQYVKVSDFKQAMHDAMCCNEFLEEPEPVKRGNIEWEDPEKKDKVVFNPDENGKWEISELPQPESVTPKFVCGMDPYDIGSAGENSVLIRRAEDHIIVSPTQEINSSEESFKDDLNIILPYFNTDFLAEKKDEVKDFEPENVHNLPEEEINKIGDALFDASDDNGQEGLFDFEQALANNIELKESVLKDAPKIRFVNPAPFVDPEQEKPIQDRAYGTEKISFEQAKERFPELTEKLDALSSIDIVDRMVMGDIPKNFETISVSPNKFEHIYREHSTGALPSGDPRQIRIVVLGEPTAQKRHKGRNMGKFVQQYDPSAADKADFLSLIHQYAPPVPFDCPLRVDCFFYFQRPASHYGTGSKAGILKPNAPTWKTSKPDRDNLDKFVMDAMSKIYFRDDSVICAGEIIKKYDKNPRTEIVITVL